MRITLEKVCKRYGSQLVLRDLTAQLEGQVVLCGPSGCGKTTLARLLLRLERPDSGRVEVPGRLAAVFQEDRLCPGLTALQNVKLVCPPGFAVQDICQGLEALGLCEQDWHKPAAQLSGGQKRRVAIVRAMLAPAQGVVLDEPFKGLDPEAKQAAMEFVLRQGQGRLLILITHEQREAAFFGPNRLWLPDLQEPKK